MYREKKPPEEIPQEKIEQIFKDNVKPGWANERPEPPYYEWPENSQAQIERDLHKLEEKKKEIEERNREMPLWRRDLIRLANDAEYAILELIGKSLLMNQCADAIQSSEFDDYFNGTDMIFRLRQNKNDPPASRPHLAIDVTTAEDGQTLLEKELRIKEHLDSGDLTQVKYFVDNLSQPREEIAVGLQEMPHAVLAIKRSNIDNLKKIAVKVNQEKPLTADEKKIVEQIQAEVQDTLRQQIDKYLAHIERKLIRAPLLFVRKLRNAKAKYLEIKKYLAAK